LMEKKMWSIAGGLTIVSFLVSPIGQKLLQGLQTQSNSVTLTEQVQPLYERS